MVKERIWPNGFSQKVQWPLFTSDLAGERLYYDSNTSDTLLLAIDGDKVDIDPPQIVASVLNDPI